ncbi:HIT family protein [Patescibacteria group bacterium]|nr:HIT family protein [Patescibacteria group bacterium]
MQTHALSDYICPICSALHGIDDENTWIKPTDLFYRDDLVAGFINAKSIRGNEGHPIIVPTKHFENVYELPIEYGDRIFRVVQLVAKALKELRHCDGITTMQTNEPAGDQHAFHYHHHVFPRFVGDTFHESLWQSYRSTPDERRGYADDLRRYFSQLCMGQDF